MSKFTKWWDSRSLTFSHLCQDDFTHGEVIITHLAVILIILAAIIAETL